MNTSLTYNGYSIYKFNNTVLVDQLKKELTVSVINLFFTSDSEKKYELFRENKDKLYIPRNFGLLKFGLPIRDLLINIGIDSPNLIFNGELRQIQKETVDLFLKAAYDPLKRGGIINVACAGGKTVMALYCACIIKKKTLFIVHKEFLGNQFKERALQFVPTARIGLIKQKIIDIKDKDFVIASLQSLALKDYDPNIFKEFGLVIIDECHHVSAEVFSNALLKITGPITMGLSATLNRKDGLRKVFEWFLGYSVNDKINKVIDSDMKINIYKYYNSSSDYNEIITNWNGKINYVGMLNNICSFDHRNQFIVNIILDILKIDTERQIIVLSERRNQLTNLEFKLIQSFPTDLSYSIGYYIGGLKQHILKQNETKQIILATYHMASEGMDIPSLNTLILASPITSIEQSIGRIQRQLIENRKYQPLCIDIVDNFSIFKNRAINRLKFYKSKKYIIENEKVKENEKLLKNNINYIED